MWWGLSTPDFGLDDTIIYRQDPRRGTLRKGDSAMIIANWQGEEHDGHTDILILIRINLPARWAHA